MADTFKKFVTLFISYYAFGRKVAVPVGINLFESWLVLLGWLFFIEAVQIPLFYFLLGPLAAKIPSVVKLKRKFSQQKKKILTLRMFRYFQQYGIWGVFIVVSMPAATGGVLGGVLLSKILGIGYKKSVAALLSGLIVGELLLIFGVKTILVMIFCNKF